MQGDGSDGSHPTDDSGQLDVDDDVSADDDEKAGGVPELQDMEEVDEGEKPAFSPISSSAQSNSGLEDEMLELKVSDSRNRPSWGGDQEEGSIFGGLSQTTTGSSAAALLSGFGGKWKDFGKKKKKKRKKKRKSCILGETFYQNRFCLWVSSRFYRKYRVIQTFFCSGETGEMVATKKKRSLITELDGKMMRQRNSGIVQVIRYMFELFRSFMICRGFLYVLDMG